MASSIPQIKEMVGVVGVMAKKKLCISTQQHHTKLCDKSLNTYNSQYRRSFGWHHIRCSFELMSRSSRAHLDECSIEILCFITYTQQINLLVSLILFQHLCTNFSFTYVFLQFISSIISKQKRIKDKLNSSAGQATAFPQ